LAAVLYAGLSATAPDYPAHRDFDQVWFAAHAMLHGQSPYQLIGPGKPFYWPWNFYYPMTAAVVGLPVAWLPMLAARLVFVGLSAFAFTYTITRDGWFRLPAVLSASFIIAADSVQWSPLLIAAALTPGLAWLTVAKPNIGAALLLARLRRGVLVPAIGVGLVILALSFELAPHWPADWIAAMRVGGYHPKPLVATLFGPIVLLALLRWRLAEARLLLLMVCVPHTLAPYETLELFLIPSSRRQALTLALLSYIASTVQEVSAHYGRNYAYNAPLCEAAFVLAMYLPALVMVLRRPNEGELPAVIDRIASRFPSWLRGSQVAVTFRDGHHAA